MPPKLTVELWAVRMSTDKLTMRVTVHSLNPRSQPDQSMRTQNRTKFHVEKKLERAWE